MSWTLVLWTYTAPCATAYQRAAPALASIYLPARASDIVVEDAYSLPFGNDYFDAVVSTSCFEHDQMFLLTFIEVARVAKAGGFIYINTPSNGPYHSKDNWRFYPDASLALAAWAHRQGQGIELMELFMAKRKMDHRSDCVMVFCKGSGGNGISRRTVDALPDSYNIRRSAGNSMKISPR